MGTVPEHKDVNLSLTKHYQKLFSSHCNAAVFPPMPGYPRDNGVTEVTLPPDTQQALQKITQGDRINLCAVLSVALNQLAHQYIPTDYPLSLIYSLSQSGTGLPYEFILVDEVGDISSKVSERVVEQRVKIVESLQLGQASLEEIEGVMRSAMSSPTMPKVQLSVRDNGEIPNARFSNALQIDYCQARSDKLRITADARRYPAIWRQSLLSNLTALLTAIVTEPEQPLHKLPMLSEEELQRVLTFSQGTQVPYTTGRLEQALERWAVETPNALALVAGEKYWSYSQLNEQANIVAHNLVRRGVKAGEMVAVMLSRSPMMMAAIYGVLKAGAAYVPVDPNYPQNRREYIIRDSGAKLVLVDGSETEVDDYAVDISIFTTLEGDLLNPRVSSDAQALAYMIYTSGSTGNPKGVMIEHHSVFNRVEWMQNNFSIQFGDVILQKTPISFDVSIWELFWWAISGATVSILPPGGEKDPGILLDTIARDQVTHMHFVPSMLDAFLNALEAGAPTAKAASLKIVFTSGEALTLHQSSRFFTWIEPESGARLVNLYGPTEATVDVTWYECQSSEGRSSVPIGRPIQNTDIMILNTNMQPVPMGVAGELCIAGVNLARGYHDRPELTEEKFVMLGAPYNRRVYRTGDLVRWLQDGEIEYLGRIDHQVKIRGYRIELGEIENAIMAVPGVKDVRVIALARDDGSKYLTAYLLPNPEYDEQQVRKMLMKNLPEFMVPPWFVTVDEFPLTPNGKLDRAQLPNPLKLASTSSFVSPESEDERALAKIWCEALNLESVGIHDNFFSLGGDSITSLGVISRARKAGMAISFQAMFSYPTIASLLPHVEKIADSQELTICPFSLIQQEDVTRLPKGLEDAYPMSQLQAGLIFQSELQKGASWYHDIQVYTLSGEFNEDAFRQALEKMVQEYPILRTSYHLQGYSEFLQFVHSDMPLPLYIHDWRELDEYHQEAQLDAFIEQECHYQFDWTQPGLIRVHIGLRSNDQFDYILSFHDSALDGWSINLFHTKLLSYYHDFRNGEVNDTPLKDQFLRKYVAMEQQTRGSKAAQDYWAKQLAGYEPMPLPRLREQQGVMPEIAYHDIDISAALSDRLRDLAVRLNVPLKNVLMAAHLRVLGLICNRKEVITGYEHSGRPEEEGVDQAIGLFLNSLPFSMTLQPDESWATLIQRIHQQEADFLPHRRFPMADMKKLVNTTESLFESVFNFTHFHMLKKLEQLPDMHGLDVRVRAETEFPLRAEFSQNAYNDKVQLSLHYHNNIFDSAHIACIGQYYAAALNAMTEDAEGVYLNTSLLPPEELQLLQQVGQGEARLLGNKSASELIAACSSQTPNKVVLQDDSQVMTAQRLSQRVEGLACALAAAGERQSTVAVALPRGVDWITVIAAIMRAGYVYLPLDLDNPDARLQELLVEGQVSVVIGDGETLPRIAELADNAGKNVALIDHRHVAGPAEVEIEMPQLNDLAYVLFTSGSTGKPKGALIEHEGMLNHMMAKINDLQITGDDVLAQTAPVTFDISVWQALTGLVVNARTVIYTKAQQLDPEAFCQQLVDDGVTLLEIVPSYFSILLDYLERSPRQLGALRVLIQTGEALKHEQVSRWFKLYPGIKLVNAYGPTEASDDITHHLFTAPPADAIVPIGKPVQNMWIHILDEWDNLVPFGTSGEICVSGVGVGRGYINSAEKTHMAFDFSHPLAAWSTGRLYRTGDLGKWRANGTLAYEGRIDEQVKIRGMRIETGEIENTLMMAPGVHNAAVVLDSRDNGDRLVGFVQGNEDTDMILQHAASLLSAYMLPEQLIYCHEIPLNAAGKVDRNQLRFFAACSSRPERSVSAAPVTEDELSVARLWSQLLNIPLESIGRESDFFELGGNSLLAMSCAIRSEGRFNLNDIFAQRTLAKLAAHSQGNSENVLHPLTNSQHGPAIICFSYAGGNAVNFQPVAEALMKQHSVRVFGVEPPGNDVSKQEALISLPALVSRCISELKAAGVDSVTVWGHCSGVGGAIMFQRMANQQGIRVESLVISGKLLRPSSVLQKQIAKTRAMSDCEVIEWLRDVTGLEVEDFSSDMLNENLAAAYRNDAIEGNLALEMVWQHPEPLSDVPVLCLLAQDDPLTYDGKMLVNNWHRFSTSLTFEMLPKGGHYFIKSEPESVAKVVVKNLYEVTAEES